MKATKGILLLYISALLIACTFGVGGCFALGRSAASSTASGTAAHSGHAADLHDFELLTGITNGAPDIYVIVKIYDSQYWQQIIDGAVDAGEAFHCNIYAGGTLSETDIDGQKTLLERAVSRGADAILFAPLDSSEMVVPVQTLYQSGTPVILIDTILNSTDYTLCYMTDNLHAGELAAEEMLHQLKSMQISEQETAQVAIQVSATTSQTIMDRLAGFSRYWALHAPETWTILDDIRCNNSDIETAERICMEYLDTCPDLRGVVGCNNSSTVGFVNGITKSGRHDIAVVGFDFSDEMKTMITDASRHASTIVQCQYDMGYRGVSSALEALDGMSDPLKFIDTGVRAVRHDNLDEPDIQRMLNPQ